MASRPSCELKSGCLDLTCADLLCSRDPELNFVILILAASPRH